MRTGGGCGDLESCARDRRLSGGAGGLSRRDALPQPPCGIRKALDQTVRPGTHRRMLGIGHQLAPALKELKRRVHRDRTLVAQHLGGVTVGRELIAVQDRHRCLHPNQAESALRHMVVGDVALFVGSQEGSQLRTDLGQQPCVEVDPRPEAVEDGYRRVGQVVLLQHRCTLDDRRVGYREGFALAGGRVEQGGGGEGERDADDEAGERGSKGKGLARHTDDRGKARTGLELPGKRRYYKSVGMRLDRSGVQNVAVPANFGGDGPKADGTRLLPGPAPLIR